MDGEGRHNSDVAVVSFCFAATEKRFVEEKWRRRRREGGFCTSAVPSEIIRWLSSTSPHSLPLLSSTKKASRPGHLPLALGPSPNFLFSVLFYFALVGILKSWHHLDPLLPCPHLGRRPGTIRFDGGDVGGRQRRGGVAWGVLAAAGQDGIRSMSQIQRAVPWRAWLLRVPVA
ncbi:hypothetical protein BHM03_00057356 [Ensete ventricosum]|nr:hypothetical protein BHM03_00057356 [Ensete ventricosum]